MFKFRFQSLLDLRVTERDHALAEVAEAMEALGRLREQREAIEEQRRQVANDGSVSRLGTLRIEGLLAQGRYERQLALELAQVRTAETQVETEVERRQRLARAAETELRRLELLKDKDRIAWDKQQAKAEQALMDELASRNRELRPWQC
jgi:flagellar FliJ protein